MITRLVVAFITTIFLLVPTSAAPVPKDSKTFGERLVGRWEMLTSRGQKPVTPVFIVLRKDKTMTLEWGVGDEVRTFEGTYKVDGESYFYDVTMKSSGQRKAEKMDVSKLTMEEMTMADPDGIVEDFKRVDDVKKDRK